MNGVLLHDFGKKIFSPSRQEIFFLHLGIEENLKVTAFTIPFTEPSLPIVSNHHSQIENHQLASLPIMTSFFIFKNSSNSVLIQIQRLFFRRDKYRLVTTVFSNFFFLF